MKTQLRKINKNYKLEVRKKTYRDKYQTKLNTLHNNTYVVIELPKFWIIINNKIYEELRSYNDDKLLAYFEDTDITQMLESCYMSDTTEAENNLREIFDKVLEDYNGGIEVEKIDEVENTDEGDKSWNGITF